MRDQEKTIGNIIDKQKICHIASNDEEGYPNIKAMLQPRIREGIKRFYFSTNTSSNKVTAFMQNNKACIYFYNNRFYQGVMLIGTIEVLEDQESKEKLWQKGDTVYYKEGVSDPDYCVLKFTAIKGRYYRNYKSEDFEI